MTIRRGTFGFLRRPVVRDTVFGLVVNPKSGELLVAVKKNESDVEIQALDGTRRGSGYYDTGAFPESLAVTGLPRAHTSAGVIARGTGLGTVLYTALCLGADMKHRRKITFAEMKGSGGGISSDSHRLPPADAWWKAAKETFGLAVQMTGCVRRNDRMRAGGNAGDDARLVAALRRKFEVPARGVRVGAWAVALDVNGRFCDVKADAYPIARARAKGLIVAEGRGRPGAAFETLGATALAVVSRPSIAAANMGILRAYGAKGRAAATMLIEMARRARVPAADLASMRRRYDTGSDRAQTRWFAAPGRAPGRAGARRNPATSRFYVGATSQRVTDSGALRADLQRVDAIRDRLGWDAFDDGDA